jgi:V/A-type H+-transporting ATPase subunit I
MSIARMKKLSLLLPRGDVDRIIAKLMYLRCVDIEQTGDDEALGLSALRGEAELAELHRRLAVIEQAIKALTRYAAQKKSFTSRRTAVDLRKFRSGPGYRAALEMAGEVNATVERIEQAMAETARCHEKIMELSPWAAYSLPLNFQGTEHTLSMLGSFPASMPEERFVAGILEAGGAVGLLGRDGGACYVSVMCHRGDEDDVARALARLGFVRATFKDIDKTPAEALEELRKTAEVELAARDEYEEKLKEYAGRLGELEILHDAVSTEQRAAETKLRLAATENCAYLSGWVPEKNEARVAAVLDRCDCAYELSEPTEGDDPPVLLENNSFAKNFEWVIGMYSYPKYGSYDPSFIMGIFYCLIFGMMFADVVYGLIMVALCFGGVKLLRPREGTRRFLLMFGYCGIACTVMGALFGGYMSDLVQQIMINFMGIDSPPSLALLLDPLQNPVGLLVVALIAGGVHLIAGMAVKLYVTWRDGHPLDAVLDTVPWWILFAGLVLLYFKPEVGRWVSISGVVSLVLTQGRKNKNIVTKFLGGVFSLYNLINFTSDLVSYSRIMALGLASAVLGQVMNILGIMLGKGPIGFIFMILVFIVGHGLNIALNILGSFVHTSRLQYIEFFGKFFEGGGRAFAPVLPADKYTADSTD